MRFMSRHAVLGCVLGLVLVLVLVVGGCRSPRFGHSGAQLRLATFSADVTVPLGHGMMGGSWISKSIADPLEANGFVLLGGDAPVVFVSVDWCEIRNDAYERWQTSKRSFAFGIRSSGKQTRSSMYATWFDDAAWKTELKSPATFRWRSSNAASIKLILHSTFASEPLGKQAQASPGCWRRGFAALFPMLRGTQNFQTIP